MNCLAIALVGWLATSAANAPIRVGSKAFTESIILGEMACDVLRDAGFAATHRRELGGTQIVFHALEAGEIDVYPEYTGTILAEVLAKEKPRGDDGVRAALARRGVGMSKPLGFNNTYAIGMREDVAARLNIITFSDLIHHPMLKFGLSNEFMERGDGWPGLRAKYNLPQRNVVGLEHVLAYRALQADEIQATELYSTDPEIVTLRLRVLKDDQNYFPTYECVLLYRLDIAAKGLTAIQRLEGKIDATRMSRMNAEATRDGRPETEVAASFVRERLSVAAKIAVDSIGSRLFKRLGEHLTLVALSLSAAILVAIPLGIIAARLPRLGNGILGLASIIQTIPSLAMLVFMIPWLGIGAKPALVALFLYSLLPIIRNTTTGLRDISPSLRESAEALGLPPMTRLRVVELPLASRAILGGIKTAAVINVGTATIGALIGAGGFGQPILTGIRRDDISMIVWEGALPAALLALVVQAGFDVVEKVVVPRVLRG